MGGMVCSGSCSTPRTGKHTHSSSCSLCPAVVSERVWPRRLRSLSMCWLSEHGACLVGDELGRDVAAVDLHALLHLHGGLQGVAGLDGQHTVRADLLQSFRNEIADHGVVAGRDGGHVLRTAPRQALLSPRPPRWLAEGFVAQFQLSHELFLPQRTTNGAETCSPNEAARLRCPERGLLRLEL